MQDLVANPKTDLYARIPWGDGQTILREALLLADHNAYHVAQLVDVRRLLGVWPEKGDVHSGQHLGVSCPLISQEARNEWGTVRLLNVGRSQLLLSTYALRRRDAASTAGETPALQPHDGSGQAQSRDLGSIFNSMSRGRFLNTALTPLRQRSSMPTTVHSISGEM